jgi:FkbM family methyltransferase
MKASKTLVLLLCLSFFSASKPNPHYVGQNLQDKYFHENFFPNKIDGTFVEIGAHNGITYSNTYFFEKLGWQGICIEPIPEVFAQLRLNRGCICINGCITNFTGEAPFLHVINNYVNTEMLSGLINEYDPRHVWRIKYESTINPGSYEVLTVQCYKLNDLLEQYGFYHIDILSIDTEGGELAILKSIDFNKFDIDVILVEDNYSFKNAMCTELEKYGFIFVKSIEQDHVFRNRKYCK